ncbi:MAG: hypothetical protein XD50_0001 [Clostridia bacterium 41_269]|nr:MAG: hypothetical protein XD50_0001 [Clostridia bacterium 41_269]
MEEKRYFAIVCLNSYFGAKILKPGMNLVLKKEPENEFDAEAIGVYLEPVGKVGYVANSIHTVPRGCCSAGRLYDHFNEQAYGVVRFVLENTAIAEFWEEKPPKSYGQEQELLIIVKSNI